MRRLLKRTKEEKLDLVKRFNQMVDGGMPKHKASDELGVAYGTMMSWLGKNGRNPAAAIKEDDYFPIVSASERKPYTKKVKPSGRAIVIVTDISSLSSVLSNL